MGHSNEQPRWAGPSKFRRFYEYSESAPHEPCVIKIPRGKRLVGNKIPKLKILMM